MNLKKVEAGNYNSKLTTAAKNIRTELKKKFKGTKFSVSSSRYSGGNSIDISWTDGPETDEVNRITNKYRIGSFDGMVDSYDYSKDRDFTNTHGGSMFVMHSRQVA